MCNFADASAKTKNQVQIFPYLIHIQITNLLRDENALQLVQVRRVPTKSSFPPGQDTFVGIFAQNSVAWHSTMQMCNHYSMVLVPLYDTLGEQAVQVRNVLKY